jgi:chemotaxis protein methyltransferase CheR
MKSSNSVETCHDECAVLQAIVNTIREPLLVLDKDLRVIAASRSFYLTFKLHRQDVQGLAIYMLGEGQWNMPDLRLLLEKVLSHQAVMEAYEVEHDMNGSGKRITLLNARTVFTEGDCEPMILLGIEDVTQARAVERSLKKLLHQKELLLREVEHRVLNSLQIIASILLLKSRTVSSEETRLHLKDAHLRVMSVAAVQQQLQTFQHSGAIEVRPYLTNLCEALAASMIADARPISLRVVAERGTVSSRDAVSLGLVTTELVINALKYAFLHEQANRAIIVSYEESENSWRLKVSDNGSGKESSIGHGFKTGFGTSIVEALSSQLEAQLEILSSFRGTQVSIAHGMFH